jgi:hypothetical protein
VFQIDGVYYACADGVWYEAAGPQGPWAVSMKTPPKLEQVPPSNPYYNTRYVEVYSATPQVVYVGYTPGYMGAYPWGGTIVYGTGFYYPPYYGGWYRPYPATWGFGASYNPWTGWGFSVGFGGPSGWLAVGTGGASFGFGVGPMAVGWYPRPYYGGVGWFGGGYYRPSWNSVHVNNININNYYRPGWNGGGIYNRPGYTRPGVPSRIRTRLQPSQQRRLHAAGHAPGAGDAARARHASRWSDHPRPSPERRVRGA